MTLLERMQNETLQDMKTEDVSLSRRIGTMSPTYAHIVSEYFVPDHRGTRFNDCVTIPFLVKPKGKLIGKFYSEATYAPRPCNVCFRANKSKPKDAPRINCIIAKSFDCCATCLCADIPCDECNWKRSTWNSVEFLAQSPPRYTSNISSKRIFEEEMQIKGVRSLSNANYHSLGSHDTKKRQKSVQSETEVELSMNLAENFDISHQLKDFSVAESAVDSALVEQMDWANLRDDIQAEECVRTDNKFEGDLVEIKAELIDETTVAKEPSVENEEVKTTFKASLEPAEEEKALTEVEVKAKESFKKSRYCEVIASQRLQIHEYRKRRQKDKQTIGILEKTVKGLGEESIRERKKYKEHLNQEREEKANLRQKNDENEKTIAELHRSREQMEEQWTIKINGLHSQIATYKENKMYDDNKAKKKEQENEEIFRKINSELNETKFKFQACEEEKNSLQKEIDVLKQELIAEQEKKRTQKNELELFLEKRGIENNEIYSCVVSMSI